MISRFRIMAAALALLCATPALASQNSGCIPTTGTVSGLSLVTQINQFFDSVMSSFSGSSEPATNCAETAVTGQFWLDTSSSPNNVRMYDGTEWVSLGTLDTSSHLFTPAPSAVAPGITIKGVSSGLYTVLDSDRGKLLSFTNSTSAGVTLPQAGGSDEFEASWTAYFTAASTGTVTITPTTSTINGASSLALLPGQSAIVISNGTNYSALVMKLGTVTSVAAGTGLSGGTITGSGTLSIDKATAGNFEAATSDKVLTSDSVFIDEVTITYAASQTLNFNTFFNAKITLTGNITAFTCSGQKAGQSGVIRFIQDGTGGRTIPSTFGCNFRFPGGEQPQLSATAGAVDALIYSCISSTYCLANFQQNYQ